MALMPVGEALLRVLHGMEPLPTVDVPLDQAHGRVLAADLVSRRTQPPDDVSAMDGYAVRAADVASAPASLQVIGEVAAGRPFDGHVAPGQAARIFTGGVMPPGADTVVIQELTSREGDIVTITKVTEAGRNVRKRGLDFAEGRVLLDKGRQLTARDLALAAAMNHPTVPAPRRAKLAFLATGDELKMPGSSLAPGQIVASNSYAIIGLARAEDAETLDLGIVPDRVDATVEAIRRARDWGADVLVTAGGASVGEHDLVQQALKAEGLTLSFWKVALRPGKPLLHGRLGAMSVLGVPGNPVSGYVCALLFLIPLLRRWAGRSDLGPDTESAVLGCDLSANDERADYMRASLTERNGALIATPFDIQDSSMVASLAKADCLVLRPPFAPAVRAGAPCSILRLGL